MVKAAIEMEKDRLEGRQLIKNLKFGLCLPVRERQRSLAHYQKSHESAYVSRPLLGYCPPNNQTSYT